MNTTAPRNRITLHRIDGAWHARFVDESAIITELFGTDTLPTPFDASTDAETVRAAIQERNADSVVSIGAPWEVVPV